MPIPTLCCATSCVEQTRDIGTALAGMAEDGDVVVLTGDLGAGKTALVQGAALALGIDGPITSPTFTLANRYHGTLVLNHLDVYRLDDVAETIDLDLPELFESGLTAIEWGERIAPVLPADRLVVRIELGSGDDDRMLRFEPIGAAWTGRLEQLRSAMEAWEIPC